MNLYLKLSYEENGQSKTLGVSLDVPSEREAAYSLQTAVGEIHLSFRPNGSAPSLTAQIETKKFDVGENDFNAELRKKMEERNVFAPKHKSRKQ